MSDARRLPSLDGLRGIAAIAIMLFHFNIFFLPQARMSSVLPLVNRAYLAVDLFFLLSGFVMAHVYGAALSSSWQTNWRKFASARFARIYPLFALTTLATVMIAALSDTQPRSISFSGRTLLLQPFLLQQWASGLNWNYPTWSISTETEAYIIFVFVAGLLVTAKHPRFIAGCCVATVAVLSVADGGSLNLFVGVPALLRTLAEFFLGVVLYRAHFSDVRSPRKWAAILAFLFFGCGLLTRQDCLVVGGFACIVHYCVGARDIFGRLLNSRPAVALGNWSYSIYLWHAPTHFAIMAAFAVCSNPVSNLSLLNARLLFLATVLLVVGLSAATHKYYEKPMRRLMKSKVPPALPGSVDV